MLLALDLEHSVRRPSGNSYLRSPPVLSTAAEIGRKLVAIEGSKAHHLVVYGGDRGISGVHYLPNPLVICLPGKLRNGFPIAGRAEREREKKT